MSTISSFLNRFFISSVFGRASSHSPAGDLPIIDIQLPALPLRVLMTPSMDVAPPPTDPAPPRSVNRRELALFNLPLKSGYTFCGS
jgi:hypothetical protein